MTKSSSRASVPHPASGASAGAGSDTGLALHRAGGGVVLGVRVTPSAPRTMVRGRYGDRLKVSVAAPPEDDRANQELTKALAKWLEIPRNSLRLETGHTSRNKAIVFTGLDERELRRRLNGLLVPSDVQKESR